MRLFNNERRQGITMIELLIILVILGLLIVLFLNYFNPLQKRDRAVDARRKSDLNRLSIALEDYYNDHNCYPTEVLCQPADEAEGLKPYLGTIPCDPATRQSYDYQPEESDCPQYYRIYTYLTWEEDPDIAAVGCANGCGKPDFTYNYGVSSPNVGLEGPEGCNQWCACQSGNPPECNFIYTAGCCSDPFNPSGCNIVGTQCYCCEEGKDCRGECE